MYRVGDKVYFGRPNGEQTLGEVVKVNRKSLKIKSIEDRGWNRGKPAGTIWRVHPSLCRPASGETRQPRRTPSRRRFNLELIPELPQRQDSVSDQLKDLKAIAVRLGMYDAADVIDRWQE